jgi:hypothetical protein
MNTKIKGKYRQESSIRGGVCKLPDAGINVLASNSKRNDGKNDKNDDENDSQLKKCFFYPPLCPVNRIGLAEDTAEAAALDLEQGYQYQSNRDDYLRDI